MMGSSPPQQSQQQRRKSIHQTNSITSNPSTVQVNLSSTTQVISSSTETLSINDNLGTSPETPSFLSRRQSAPIDMHSSSNSPVSSPALASSSPETISNLPHNNNLSVKSPTMLLRRSSSRRKSNINTLVNSSSSSLHSSNLNPIASAGSSSSSSPPLLSSSSLSNSGRRHSASGSTSVNNGKKSTAATKAMNAVAEIRQRNRDLHRAFPSSIIPKNEYCIEYFSCAFFRHVLREGRLYVTPSHFCFHCSLPGLFTQLVIPVNEVTAIKRANTAYFIPNAIEIYTANDRYFFGTVRTREKAFHVLETVWRNCFEEEDNEDDVNCIQEDDDENEEEVDCDDDDPVEYHESMPTVPSSSFTSTDKLKASGNSRRRRRPSVSGASAFTVSHAGTTDPNSRFCAEPSTSSSFWNQALGSVLSGASWLFETIYTSDLVSLGLFLSVMAILSLSVYMIMTSLSLFYRVQDLATATRPILERQLQHYHSLEQIGSLKQILETRRKNGSLGKKWKGEALSKQDESLPPLEPAESYDNEKSDDDVATRQAGQEEL